MIGLSDAIKRLAEYNQNGELTGGLFYNLLEPKNGLMAQVDTSKKQVESLYNQIKASKDDTDSKIKSIGDCANIIKNAEVEATNTKKVYNSLRDSIKHIASELVQISELQQTIKSGNQKLFDGLSSLPFLLPHLSSINLISDHIKSVEKIASVGDDIPHLLNSLEAFVRLVPKEGFDKLLLDINTALTALSSVKSVPTHRSKRAAVPAVTTPTKKVSVVLALDTSHNGQAFQGSVNHPFNTKHLVVTLYDKDTFETVHGSLTITDTSISITTAAAEKLLAVVVNADILNSLYDSVTGLIQGGSGSGTGTVPAGTISFTLNNNVPSGYLLCDGSSKDKTIYATLYAAIGGKFGESGNSFKLPPQVDPDGNGLFIRGLSGSVAIGTIQKYSVEKHNHSLSSSCNSGRPSIHRMSSFDYQNEFPVLEADSNAAGASNHTDDYGELETRPSNITALMIIKY